jgi:hypothetical protein
MSGVLNAGGGGPPPAPNPDAQAQAPSNGILSAPGMSAPPPMAPGGGAPGMPPGQAPQTPAPTHGQTVAALRHFDAIKVKLGAILKDPALGKSSVKSKIVDGMADLVADRIVTPGAAVAQLAGVPDKPFDQKQWLMQHYQQSINAEIAILSHHAKAFGGTPDEMIDKRSSPDNHLSDMAALHSQYGGGRG